MGILYIVPTPIGNLKDITLRAIEIFKSESLFLSEDTRVTRKLLSLLEIDYSDKKFISFFDHNEERRISSVLEILQSGQNVVLVSDAGTPLLNDPGFKLVREIRLISSDSGEPCKIKVEVLPGATSITTALVASGLPTDKFTFIGYFPRKNGKKEHFVENLIEANKLLKTTYIGFESPYRVISTLETLKKVCPRDCVVSICNDLTKLHELAITGPIDMVLSTIKNLEKIKGEFIISFHVGN